MRYIEQKLTMYMWKIFNDLFNEITKISNLFHELNKNMASPNNVWKKTTNSDSGYHKTYFYHVISQFFFLYYKVSSMKQKPDQYRISKYQW